MNTIEIGVEKTLSNGCGLGRDGDGRVVFVPGALPGEVYAVDRLVKRKNTLWAEGCQRLRDAAIRVAPDCPHYGSCGGCGLLHAQREAELGIKVSFLEDALRRIGKMADYRIEPMDFPFEGSRARGKLHVDARGRLGFKAAAGDAIADIPHCAVMPPALRSLLPALGDWVRRLGFVGEIHFALGEGGAPVLACRGSHGPNPADHPPPAGVQGVTLQDGSGRELARFGQPAARFSWNGIQVALAPAQFFQSNPASWPVFFRWTRAYLKRFEPRSVWDVHAGAGFLTSALAGRKVIASEPDKAAQAVLRQVLARLGGEAKLHSGPAERAIGNRRLGLADVEGVLLDPPRAGLSGSLTEWLLAHGPRALLYFSCDAASFSRDLRRLSARYRLASPVLAMNVSPGSLRLETAAILAEPDIA